MLNLATVKRWSLPVLEKILANCGFGEIKNNSKLKAVRKALKQNYVSRTMGNQRRKRSSC